MNAIDHVLARLEQTITDSLTNQDRVGYFASLYKRVTLRIRDAVSSGLFDDGQRMETLDVTFASRYFAALDQFRGGDSSISPSWKIALDATQNPQPIILQHLLLAMNAHINIDLAVASAQTCPGQQLAALKADFMKINSILAGIVPQVQEALGDVSPLIYLADEVGGHFGTSTINFDMGTARDASWVFANVLAPLDTTQQQLAISQYEHIICDLARAVLAPAPPLSWVVSLIAAKESRNVVAIINALNS